MENRKVSPFKRMVIRKLVFIVTKIRQDCEIKISEIEREEIYGCPMYVVDLEEYHNVCYKPTYTYFNKIIHGCNDVLKNIKNVKDLLLLLKELEFKTYWCIRLNKLYYDYKIYFS